MDAKKHSNRICIVGSGSRVIPITLLHELTAHGFNCRVGDISEPEMVRQKLVLPNRGVTAYDVLHENDLLSIMNYKPKFNKPSSSNNTLEFELYIKLMKDRRSNKHFKMMRRFT